MNTPDTTTSGNVHGMSLAALLGPAPAELSQIGGFAPTVIPSKTVLLGVRNLDPAERRRVIDSGTHVFTMNDIDREGLAGVAARAITLAGAATGGFHVSFDLDAFDPTIAPGVGTAVRGGLSYRCLTNQLGVSMFLKKSLFVMLLATFILAAACGGAEKSHDAMAEPGPKLTCSWSWSRRVPR